MLRHANPRLLSGILTLQFYIFTAALIRSRSFLTIQKRISMNGKDLGIDNFKESKNRQKEIHILLLEDNPADAELIEFELSESELSFTMKRVETEETFGRALKEFAPNLILSDYDLPTYSGIQALGLAKKVCPNVPFILVTGAVTEDRAIEVLTSGARDYVLKNRLSRLVPAVRRALAEAEEHRARRRVERELQKSYALLERRVAERTAELEREITERKRTEDALRASEAQLETTVENLAEAVIVSDPQGNIMHWNQSGTAMFEIEKPDHWRIPLARFTEKFELAELDGTSLPLEQWPLSRILRGERLRDWEVRLSRRDKDWQRILSFSGDLVRDRYEFPLMAVVSINDITDRKKAEEALKFTQTSVDVAAEMIAWFAPDGKIVYVNDATSKSLGYSRDELMNMTLWDIDPEFNPERLKQTWKDIRISKTLTVQTTHRRKDESFYPAEITVNFVQYAGREYLFAHGLNITERKRAENELTESRQLWIATLSSIGDAVIATDNKGRITFMNAVAENTTGWAATEVLFEPVTRVFNIVNENTHQRVVNPVEKVLKEGMVFGFANHTVLIRKDGKEIPIDDSGAPIQGTDGKITGVVLVFRDVTEKKEAQEMDRLRAELLRLSFDAIIIRSPDGGVESWNRGAEQLYGYTSDEAIGRITNELLKTVYPVPWPVINRVLNDCRCWEGELRQWTKDGREVDVSARYQLIRGRDSFIRVLEINRDITKHKKAEEALRESEQRFRVAQELSPDGFTILEPVRDKKGLIVDFTWLYENTAIARLNGTDPDAVIGKNLLDLFSGLRKTRIFETFVEVAETGKPTVIEEMYEGENIVPTWFRLAVVPIKDSIAILSEDITDKKQAEENIRNIMQRFYNVLSEMFDAILLVTNEGLVEFANKAFCEIYDLKESPSELNGLTAEEVISKIKNKYLEPDEAVARILETISHGQPVRGEEVVMSDGRICLRDYIPIAVNGKNYGRLWHHFDITELKRTEKALKETEAHFRLALKNAPVSVAIQDRDLRYIWAYNQKTASPKELIGKRDEDIFTPEEARHIVALKKRVLDEDIELREQMWFNRPGGRIFLDVYWEPVHDEKGNIMGVGQTTVNMTPVKTAEDALKRSEEQLREMADAMPQLVWTATPEGRIDYYNKRCDEFPDLVRQDTGYWDWHAVIHPEDLEATLDMWQKAIKCGAENQIEHRLRQKDGSFRWKLSRGVAVKNDEGKIIKWIGTTTDIHDLKQAEQESKSHSLQLENTNKELESFSYSVSHDLRAPLRAIDGFSRMLMKSEQSYDQETNRRIQVIRENALKMDRLITDLLYLSRSGRVTLTKNRIDMHRLVTEIWKEQILINPGRNMELMKIELPSAVGDEALVRQVLSNLLANAVKFTRHREKALIEVGGVAKDKENIYYIKDNGIGFDMKYYDKLFGVFQRLHSESEYEGTGVGLAIVQRIIHKHGGRVWAEGDIGKGATFYFSFPN